MHRFSNPPDAAILCGGLGTRLRGALPGLPKCLAPVNGRPFLDILLAALEAGGVRRIVLCVGVGAGAVRAHAAGYTGPLELLLSEEASPLGTGGALALARPLLRTDPVLVLNGDSMVPGLDYTALAAAGAAIVVVPADARSDAGTITLGTDGRVSQFAEKQATGGGYHNAGVYRLPQRWLAAIPAGLPVSLERELMPQWVAAGLRAYVHAGELVDIGTPERLAAAQGRL